MKLDFFAFLCPEAKSLNILQWFHFWKTQILKAQRSFFPKSATLTFKTVDRSWKLWMFNGQIPQGDGTSAC